MNSREFEEIYSKYNSRFIVFALRYVRDRTSAEDIVMDSFISFWEHHDQLGNNTNHLAYLFTTVRNNCMNHLIRQQRHNQIEKELFDWSQRMITANLRSLDKCDPTVLFGNEVMAIVRQEMEGMPEITRKVFEASRFSNKTYAEIAEDLGISQRKVISEIQKALAHMRSALKDYLPSAVIALILGELTS